MFSKCVLFDRDLLLNHLVNLYCAQNESLQFFKTKITQHLHAIGVPYKEIPARRPPLRCDVLIEDELEAEDIQDIIYTSSLELEIARAKQIDGLTADKIASLRNRGLFHFLPKSFALTQEADQAERSEVLSLERYYNESFWEVNFDDALDEDAVEMIRLTAR